MHIPLLHLLFIFYFELSVVAAGFWCWKEAEGAVMKKKIEQTKNSLEMRRGQKIAFHLSLLSFSLLSLCFFLFFHHWHWGGNPQIKNMRDNWLLVQAEIVIRSEVTAGQNLWPMTLSGPVGYLCCSFFQSDQQVVKPELFLVFVIWCSMLL